MKNLVIALTVALTNICLAQTEAVILDCERIGEPQVTASLEIDLKEKTVIFDSHDVREKWEHLNQMKLKKYQQSVDANDELGKKWWAPAPYEPTRYEISSVSKNEVTAKHPFPIKGMLKVNRNTLIAYRSIVSPSGFEEASFKFKKVTKGF